LREQQPAWRKRVQIGLATGIAVYGTIFSASLSDHIGRALTAIRVPPATQHQVAALVQDGATRPALAAISATSRAELHAAIRNGFAHGLNELVIISGILALAGATAALTLIRPRDFIISGAPAQDVQNVTT
jgi:hypothetical protein